MLTDHDVEKLARCAEVIRHLAGEIERTAIGSSRIDMYRAIARELRAEADTIARIK